MYRVEQALSYSPGRTQQNLADLLKFGKSTDIADIVDIIIKTGRQNIVKYSRIWQITVDCCRLQQSHNQSLIAKLVKTGGYV